MAWIQATNVGKGFITHADRFDLTIRGDVNDLWELGGAPATITTWATRVSGVAKTDQEAADIISAWNAYLYDFAEFWIDKLSANAATAMMTLALTDTPVREIMGRWLQDTIDVREQQYKDDLAYLLANGHIQQAKHDSMLLNKSGL